MTAHTHTYIYIYSVLGQSYLAIGMKISFIFSLRGKTCCLLLSKWFQGTILTSRGMYLIYCQLIIYYSKERNIQPKLYVSLSTHQGIGFTLNLISMFIPMLMFWSAISKYVFNITMNFSLRQPLFYQHVYTISIS